MSRYEELKREVARLGKEIEEERKALARKEKEFTRLCQEKWALEEKMVGVTKVPARKPSSRPVRSAPQKVNFRGLLDQVGRGEISEEELRKQLLRVL